MKRISTTVFSILFALSMMAQGWPAQYGGVMLQGFFWDSYVDTQWANLEEQAAEMGDYFDLIWVPQSGNCNSTGNVMGYLPVYWFDHNSSFGTEEQLRSFIQTCKKYDLGVIADVVINHRNVLGVGGSWVDFPAETYKGVTYQLGLADICKNDDGGATAKKYEVTGANDTGEGWSGARDLDHTSQNVQDNVIAYLNFLLNDLGYAGFRYDMTKGYAAKYTGLYNSTTKPTFSVGEYWDGYYPTVKNWIDGTKVDGVIQSASFDFPTRYAIRDACNQNNWSKLSSKGINGYDEYKRYSVTFVDNHDTQYRSASEPQDPVKSFVEAANAYILTMPGTPCVFLQHWKQYKSSIKQLITLRKLAGIHNESEVKELNSSGMLYAAEVTGTKGKLILSCGMGTPAVSSSDYQLVEQGSAYKVYATKSLEQPWISVPSGNYSESFQVTLSAISTDADAKLVYTTDGSRPTASSASVDPGTSLTIDGASATLTVGLLSGGVVKNVITRHYTIKPFEPHTATVYLKDPQWPSLYFYAWANDGKNTQLNGGWPGKTVTDYTMINGEKWYCQTFDIATADYSFNIIFDQGMGKDQTVDIGPITQDKYYEMAAKVNGKYTVKDVTSVMTGIEGVVADVEAQTAQVPLRVYTLNGQLLRTLPAGTSLPEAVAPLAKGIYVVNGKKVVK